MAGRLDGVRVGVTADRRADEQIRLLEGRGAICTHGPAIRTVLDDHNDALRATTIALAELPPSFVVVTTGLGLYRWREAALEFGFERELAELLGAAELWARGPKSARVIRDLGFDPAWVAPGATYDDVVHELGARLSDMNPADDPVPVGVAVQLDGSGAHDLVDRLSGLGATVTTVPLYRWTIPDDTTAAEALIRAALERELDAVTFTAKPAVDNIFEIADRIGLHSDLVRAFGSDVTAVCVGPVCAGGFAAYPDIAPLVPERHRLGAMVSLMSDQLGT